MKKNLRGFAFLVLPLIFSACGQPIERATATHAASATPPANVAAPENKSAALDAALLEAVEAGDAEKTGELLAAGANANATEAAKNSADSPRNALGIALTNKSANIIALLLENGADISAARAGAAKSEHALPIAVRGGDVASIEAIEDFDAKRNRISFSGRLVTLARDERTLEYLIKSGRSINETDADENTSLTLAAGRGDANLIGVLLKLGANRHLRDSKGKTALQIAEANNNVAVVQLLKSKNDRSASADLIEKLTGSWKKDGAEECYCQCLDIQFDDADDSFCVQSNQIYISVYYQLAANAKSVNIFFKEPTDLGRGGMGLDWDSFDREQPIAVIDVSRLEKSGRIALDWRGFTDAKTKRRTSEYGSEYQGDYKKFD